MSANSAWRSRIQNKIVGTTIRITEVTSTILVCSAYLRKCSLCSFKSLQTKNPMPPIRISAISVTQTTQFVLYPVKDDIPNAPIRSNPALQKAEMEWKIP